MGHQVGAAEDDSAREQKAIILFAEHNNHVVVLVGVFARLRVFHDFRALFQHGNFVLIDRH